MKASSYTALASGILADNAASEWLKRAVLALEKRDPVDAHSDVVTLMAITTLRWREAQEREPVPLEAIDAVFEAPQVLRSNRV